MNFIGDLNEQVVSNILKRLHIHGDCSDRGIDQTERFKHEVFPLIFEHRHYFRTIREVFDLLLLLGSLQLTELLIGTFQLL